MQTLSIERLIMLLNFHHNTGDNMEDVIAAYLDQLNDIERETIEVDFTNSFDNQIQSSVAPALEQTTTWEPFAPFTPSAVTTAAHMVNHTSNHHVFTTARDPENPPIATELKLDPIAILQAYFSSPEFAQLERNFGDKGMYKFDICVRSGLDPFKGELLESVSVAVAVLDAVVHVLIDVKDALMRSVWARLTGQ